MVLFEREKDIILGMILAKNRRIRGRLALMMASSGSRTVHSRPIGSVHVGSSKEMIMSDLSRTMEMAVMLRHVRTGERKGDLDFYSQNSHTKY